MKLTWQPLPLQLLHPFHIAHGVSTTRDNVLVHLDSGVGEAAAVPYHGETAQGIGEYLRGLALERVGDVLELQDLLAALPAAGSTAARAAVDMALHDLWGQALGQPLYRLLGLNPRRLPPTSFTIPIGPTAQMAELARQADAAILKIKLGSDSDEERLAALRAASSLPLRVDVNGGWSVERAEQLVPVLVEHGVELLEQPLPAGDLEGLQRLARLHPRPPIFVDESIKSSADILAHRGLVEGVVIKLAKSGGIRPALEQIAVARACGLEVMIGCMIESSVAVTAAAHLAPLARYADLDGPLLIANDPFIGLRQEHGRLQLPDGPGLGLRPAPPASGAPAR